MAVCLGSAMLGIAPRHLMRKEPRWISQLGKHGLFQKIPCNLYRLWATHFVAHEHRSSMLFKKSIQEQRERFYGVQDLVILSTETVVKHVTLLLIFQAMKQSQDVTPGKQPILECELVRRMKAGF